MKSPPHPALDPALPGSYPNLAIYLELGLSLPILLKIRYALCSMRYALREGGRGGKKIRKPGIRNSGARLYFL